jgi:methyl-accepting chemotaxis protein
MSADRPRYKRSLRNLLLDRRFQLKYTLAIVLAGGVLFGAMEALFYDEVRQNSELAIMTPDAAFAAEMQAQLLAEDRKVLLILVGFWLALVATLFVVGILATHRIVGPLYVMDRYIRRIKDGRAVHARPLRRGDEFQNLYNHINEMAESLRADRLAEVEALQRVLDRAEVRLESLRTRPGGAELATALDEDLEPIRALVQKKRGWLLLPDEDTVDQHDRN